MNLNRRYTQELADYIYSMDFSSFNPHVVNITKMCIQDFIGVAIAGATKPEAAIWKRYYALKPTAPQATLLCRGFKKTAVEEAAALNAVFGHVMDLDDVHNASITHLAAITIPSALALAEQLNKSGKDLIEAVAAGYEAGARIGEAITPSAYHYWHTTSVVGAFAAAAASAKLLGLSPDEIVNALGSAGTQAGGLWEFLAAGAMSKVLHVANANLCGLRSAELARLGFTGASSILEGERGFIRALAPQYELECLIRGYHQGFKIEENSFKPYACCRHTHSANYCIEKILAAHDLNPEEIESITDETYQTAVQTADNPAPKNPYTAKFSLQFCIAAAIVLNDLSDRAFTDENIKDPRIRRIMDKIRIVISPELDEEFRLNPDQWSHRLTIITTTGHIISEQVDFPIGDFKNPFNQEMADNKFCQLTETALGTTAAATLMDHIHNLEHIESIHEIFT